MLRIVNKNLAELLIGSGRSLDFSEPKTLFEKKLEEANFDGEKIKIVMHLLDTICLHCLDYDESHGRNCGCNDYECGCEGGE